MSAVRSGAVAVVVLMAATTVARAVPYHLNGVWVEVDYWADDGSVNPPNETILVIDWNNTNGPYATESHAWGYRWSGTQYVSDLVAAVSAAGALDVTTSSGGQFVDDAFYTDPLIDADQHTSVGLWSGWWWTGSTADGGQTWDANGGGITGELLADGQIEGLNLDEGNWTSATLTIPAPEPAGLGFVLAIGGIWGLRRARRGERGRRPGAAW
jgi:hypothetical protein